MTELMKVDLKVEAREWYEGEKQEWEFLCHASEKVNSKMSLYRTCQSIFGRCTGKIPMGWTFVKKEPYADGTNRYTEYKVVVSGDHVVEPTGFTLKS